MLDLDKIKRGELKYSDLSSGEQSEFIAYGIKNKFLNYDNLDQDKKSKYIDFGRNQGFLDVDEWSSKKTEIGIDEPKMTLGDNEYDVADGVGSTFLTDAESAEAKPETTLEKTVGSVVEGPLKFYSGASKSVAKMVPTSLETGIKAGQDIKSFVTGKESDWDYSMFDEGRANIDRAFKPVEEFLDVVEDSEKSKLEQMTTAVSETATGILALSGGKTILSPSKATAIISPSRATARLAGLAGMESLISDVEAGKPFKQAYGVGAVTAAAEYMTEKYFMSKYMNNMTSSLKDKVTTALIDTVGENVNNLVVNTTRDFTYDTAPDAIKTTLNQVGDTTMQSLALNVIFGAASNSPIAKEKLVEMQYSPETTAIELSEINKEVSMELENIDKLLNEVETGTGEINQSLADKIEQTIKSNSFMTEAEIQNNVDNINVDIADAKNLLGMSENKLRKNILMKYGKEVAKNKKIMDTSQRIKDLTFKIAENKIEQYNTEQSKIYKSDKARQHKKNQLSKKNIQLVNSEVNKILDPIVDSYKKGTLNIGDVRNILLQMRNAEYSFTDLGKDQESKALMNAQFQTFMDKLGSYETTRANMANTLAEDVFQPYGITLDSKMADAMQRYMRPSKYGDSINQAQLVDELGIEKAERVIQSSQALRQFYDKYGKSLNKIYADVGIKPIELAPEYIRELPGEGGLIKQAGKLLTEPMSMIGETMGGEASPLRSKNPLESSLNKQKGGENVDRVNDAVLTALNYVNEYSYESNVRPYVTVLGTLSEQIQTRLGSDGKQLNLPRLEKTLKSLEQHLGRKDTLENQRLEQNIGGLKKIADTTINASKGAAILAKPTVILMTGANLPLAAAQMARYGVNMTDFKANIDNMAESRKLFREKSSLYKGRFFELDTKAKLEKKLSKSFALDVMRDAIELADKGVTSVSWHTFYNQAVNQGLSEADAIKQADVRTRETIGGRNIGERALSQLNTSEKLLKTFSLEIENQWRVLQILGEQSIKGDKNSFMGLMSYFLGVYLMNPLFRKIVGYAPLDGDVVGAFMNSKKAGEGALDTMNEFRKNLTSEVVSLSPSLRPGLNILNASMGQGAKTKFNDRFFGESGDEIMRFQGRALPVEGIIEVLTADSLGEFAKETFGNFLPGGGGAIKFSEGASTGITGEYRKDGQLAAVTDASLINAIQGGLFGRWSIQEMRDYVDRDFTRLTENQTELFDKYHKQVSDITGMNKKEIFETVIKLKGTRSRADKLKKLRELGIKPEHMQLFINIKG